MDSSHSEALGGYGNGNNSRSNALGRGLKGPPPIRTITVSMTCVMESMQQLRLRREERESLIRGMLSILGYVMQAVHFTTSQVDDVAAQQVTRSDHAGPVEAIPSGSAAAAILLARLHSLDPAGEGADASLLST